MRVGPSRGISAAVVVALTMVTVAGGQHMPNAGRNFSMKAAPESNAFFASPDLPISSRLVAPNRAHTLCLGLRYSSDSAALGTYSSDFALRSMK
jgi:hypothetical protein